MNKYPEYKSSNIPWIGDVPKHWEIVRNKAILIESKRTVGANHTQYQLLSLTKGGVIVRDISSGKGKFPNDFGTYKIVDSGQIIFCLFDFEETPRTVGLSKYNGMITGAYNIFSIKAIKSRFLEYYYISLDDVKALSQLCTGLRFEKADIFESDFSKATVITLFLLNDINLRLRPKILDMKPGTRIVSNTFDMSDWKPDQTAQIMEDTYWNTANLWIVPAKVDGTWTLDDGQIKFTQEFQYVTGTLTVGNKEMELTGKLDGDKIRFNAGGTEYTGTVSGSTISGKRTGGGTWKATRELRIEN